MVDLDKRIEKIWPKLSVDERLSLINTSGRFGEPVGSTEESMDPVDKGYLESETGWLEDRAKNRK